MDPQLVSSRVGILRPVCLHSLAKAKKCWFEETLKCEWEKWLRSRGKFTWVWRVNYHYPYGRGCPTLKINAELDPGW